MAKTKTYFIKRVREVEDKYKFKGDGNKDANKDGITKLRSELEAVTKDRNILAQKVFDLEMQN